MASQIDSTKPVTGNPTTGSVREQFAAAKNEMNTMLRMTTDVKPTSGSSTAYAVTYDIAPGSLVNGLRILAKADEACGASPTLNVNGLGAKSIVHPDGQALVAGEIAGGSHYLDLVYNSANDTWTLMNPSNVKADQLTTARDIELTGSVTGSVAFNGTSDVQLATSLSASAGLTAYPVGSIYLSTVATSPAEIFGGNWEAIGGGRVLIGAGSTTDINSETQSFSLGATGGGFSHTLTEAQIPEHKHASNLHVESETVVIDNSLQTSGATGQELDHNNDSSGISTDTGLTGGGNSHPNVQPYLTVNMWKRLADS